MSDSHLSTLRFADLDLPAPVLQGLDDAGFEFCTQIQAETLPHALAGTDVAGQAKTGTGKTAAFLVAIFTHLIRNPAPAERSLSQPLALVVAPTRELAVQIHKDAELIGRHCGFRIGLVFGGTGYVEQREYITEGVDILIGTPGRLIDYFKQKVFNLQACEVAVLDEADRMFDLGFIADIRFLFRRMPAPDQRLSMLFSATLSLRVTELAYEHMNNPIHVRAGSKDDGVAADNVVEMLYHPATNEKIPLLVGLMRKLAPTRSIVFVNTKRSAEAVNDYLLANGVSAGMLSGDVPQTKRLKLLNQFQTGDLPVLIATDVAARGLHISEVSHVFNFDLPQQAEDYVHRIGRTARAGSSGTAISFACEEFAFSLPEIETYVGHKIEAQPIDNELLPPLERPPRRERRRDSRDGRGGRGRDGGRDGGRGRGGRSGDGKGRRRSSPGGPPPAAAEGQAPKAAGAESDDATRKRRRRRRKPAGNTEQAATTTPGASGGNTES